LNFLYNPENYESQDTQHIVYFMTRGNSLISYWT